MVPGINELQFSFENGELAVTPATLTVTADDKTKVYGAANPAFTASYSGWVGLDSDSSNDLTGSPSLTTLADVNSDVIGSPYPITAAVGTLASTNYQFSFENGELAVTPATLTVTADDKTKVYGEANPAFTATYSGFVGLDSTSSNDLTGFSVTYDTR